MTPPFEPGARFGDLEHGYDIVRLLREEPGGAVYQATAKGERAVKLRVLGGGEEAVRKALRTAGLVQELGHEHVVPVLAAGTREGTAFIASDAVAGESLAELVARVGALPADRAVEIVLPLVAAVAAGHACGITRAELTASRVLLPRNEQGAVVPKIADFGLPQAGAPADAYLAPEHEMPGLRGAPGCDQYVLGLLLYEAVTGQRPRGTTVEPPSAVGADVPADLDAVIVRALKLRHSDRFASVIAFGRALLPFAASKVAAAWEPRLVAPAAPLAKTPAPVVMPLPAPARPSAAVASIGSGAVAAVMPDVASAAAFAAGAGGKPVPRTALLPALVLQRPTAGVMGTKIVEGPQDGFEDGFEDESEAPAEASASEERAAPAREPAMQTRMLEDSRAGGDSSFSAESSFNSDRGVDERSLSLGEPSIGVDDSSLAVEGRGRDGASDASLGLPSPRRPAPAAKRGRPAAHWLPWVIGIGGIVVGAAGAGLFLTLSHEHEAPALQSPPPPPVVAPAPPPPAAVEPPLPEPKIRPARRKSPPRAKRVPAP
jgi:hypothetical protein